MADTSINTVMHVAAAAPATDDAAGYAALIWTEVLGIVSIGEKGDDAEDVTVSLLKTGRVEHSIGAIDGGSVAISCKNLLADAGQVIIKAGNNNDVDHSGKMTDPDGTILYFQGKIASGKYTEKTSSAYEGYGFEWRINTATVVA